MRHPDFLTAAEVMAQTGSGRTKHFVDVRLGLLPPPIRRGYKWARWRADEIAAVISARTADSSEAAQRELVLALVAARSKGGTLDQ